MNAFSQETAITDTEIALKRLGGDRKLLATLAGFFLEDAPQLMSQLSNSCDGGDLPTAARLAHSLKGLSCTFEAIPFVQLAAEVEALARAGEQVRLTEKLARLQLEFERLTQELRAMLQ